MQFGAETPARIWDSSNKKMTYLTIEDLINKNHDIKPNKWNHYPDCHLPTHHLMLFAGFSCAGKRPKDVSPQPLFSEDVCIHRWADKVCKVVIRFDTEKGFQIKAVPFQGSSNYAISGGGKYDIPKLELIGNVWEHPFLTDCDFTSVEKLIENDINAVGRVNSASREFSFAPWMRTSE